MTTHAQANKSQLRANFLNGFSNKKIWLILILVNVFAIPYAILSVNFMGGETIVSLSLSAFAMVINMLLGMVIPFIQFDYCYEKTKVDMAYSLPLTRKQKFLTDYFSGLCMYVGAYVLQIILSYVATAFCLLYSEKSGHYNYYFSRMFMESDSAIWSMITKTLVIILLIQIMLYTVTSFVLSCTGAIFEAVSATIYFNILLPSTVYMIYLLCASNLFGIDLQESFETFVYRTSPLGGFIYLANHIFSYSGYVQWIGYYIIITILFFLITYFIMVHRKAEWVGKPFVIRSFYHIVLIAIMLHIGVLACYTTNSIVSFLLMTGIFYFVIEMVTNRGLKKIGRSCIRYVTIIATVLAVIITINQTNCFGIGYHVSDPNNIQRINLGYGGVFSDFYSNQITIATDENINKLVEVQKQLIEEYKEQDRKQNKGLLNMQLYHTYETRSFLSSTIHMDVYMKNGKNYRRTYTVPYTTMLKLLDVELSEEYIANKMKEAKRNTTYLRITDIYGASQKIVVQDKNEKNEGIITEFYDALRQDLQQTSKEEYLRPSNTTKYVADTDRWSICILESYENTIKFLEKYHAMYELTEADYDNIVDSSSIELFPMLDENEIANSWWTDFNGYYTTAVSPYYGANYSYILTDYKEQVKELLKVAQIQYASEVPCYKFMVNGRTYIIPAEYNDMVQRIINDMNLQSGTFDSYQYKD